VTAYFLGFEIVSSRTGDIGGRSGRPIGGLNRQSYPPLFAMTDAAQQTSDLRKPAPQMSQRPFLGGKDGKELQRNDRPPLKECGDRGFVRDRSHGDTIEIPQALFNGGLRVLRQRDIGYRKPDSGNNNQGSRDAP
jgi:hypothetical protein